MFKKQVPRQPRPVDSTDSCRDAEKCDVSEFSTRNVSVSVTKIMNRLITDSLLRREAGAYSIVESLVLVILARRSSRFTEKEYGRFYSSLQEMANRIQNVEDSGAGNEEQIYVKYWTDFYFRKLAPATDHLIPPTCSGTPLFAGWLRRWVHRLISRRDYSTLYSLVRSKLAWPALGNERKVLALRDHATDLGTPPLPLSSLAVYQIRRTCREIFGDLPTPTKLVPSLSACSQASREKGGAASLFNALRVEPSHEGLVLGAPRELNQRLEEWRRQTFLFARGRAQGARIYKCDSDLNITHENLDPELNPEWFVRYDLDRNKSSNLCYVIALPEPAKFRIITKMDGYLSTALQPLQGQLLSAWKATSWNTMVRDVQSQVLEMDQNCGEPLFCSGDYKAATDKMNGNACREALRGLPGSLLPLASTFLQNVLVYKTMTDTKFVQQRTGQLMGHPLSFPILCAVNVACFRTALERWVAGDPHGYISIPGKGKCWRPLENRSARAKRMDRYLIVNGDDILFKCDLSFYEVWKSTCFEFGFILSSGKCFLDPDMAQINSELYARRGGVMVRQGYLNQRLLGKANVKKSLEDDSLLKCSPNQIGKDISLMVDLAPWTRCCIPMAFDRWIGDFKGWFQPNWYLPVHLGGFGVHVKHAPHDIRITRGQRMMAARFVNDPDLQLYRVKGGNLKVLSGSRLLLNWKVLTELPHDSGSRPSGQGYVVESEGPLEDWLTRTSYIAQAAGVRSTHLDESSFFRLLKARAFGCRLKPMTDLGLFRHWTLIISASHVPPIPPLHPLS